MMNAQGYLHKLSQFKDEVPEWYNGVITPREYNYQAFHKTYCNFLKAVARENGWQISGLPKFSFDYMWRIGMHCCFETDKGCVYFCIKDVRGTGTQWFDRVMVRRCQDTKHTAGGNNTWTSLPELVSTINWLLDR